jgi:hypothetical protein
MGDLLYLLESAAFFAAMLAYVRGCERLGRSSDGENQCGRPIPVGWGDRGSVPGLPDVHPARPRAAGDGAGSGGTG